MLVVEFHYLVIVAKIDVRRVPPAGGLNGTPCHKKQGTVQTVFINTYATHKTEDFGK